MKILALGGYSGSGKSTCAEILCSEVIAPDRVCGVESFADAIKEVAEDYFLWDGKKGPKGRKLLQHLGDVGREYNRDLWVDITIRSIKEQGFDYCIIDDVRYPNEISRVKDAFGEHNCVFAWIARSSKKASEHSSESSLSPKNFELTITNTTKKMLVTKLEELLTVISKKENEWIKDHMQH